MKEKIVDFLVLFIRRAHSPDCPLLDSNPVPTDYETRALTNAPPGTIVKLYGIEEGCMEYLLPDEERMSLNCRHTVLQHVVFERRKGK